MLRVRTFLPSDYEAVWELYLDGNNATDTNAGIGPWNDDLRSIEKTYLGGDGEFLVGLLEDEIVAMGALRKTSHHCAELKRIRAKTQYWRRGFGQTILTALERRARELGYTQLHLDTSVRQRPAQKFYLKNGYRETHRATVHLHEHPFELIYYEKDL
jgi:GNAT superfamily N-acetyltransferase